MDVRYVGVRYLEVLRYVPRNLLIRASTSDISQQSELPPLSDEMEQNVPLSVLGSGGMTRRSAIAARPRTERLCFELCVYPFLQ